MSKIIKMEEFVFTLYLLLINVFWSGRRLKELFEEAVLAVSADCMPKCFTLRGLRATQTEKYVLLFIVQ